MTHAYLGLIALDVLLLLTGGCVLWALGLMRDPAYIWQTTGLAFVTGWASFGIVASLALAAGLSVDVPEAVALCALLIVGSLVIGRRVPATAGGRERPAQPQWSRLLGLGSASLLGVYLVALFVRAFVGPADTSWDSWAFWLPKAKAIYYFGGLDTGPGGFTSFASRHYPPLLPGLDSTAFHFMGGVHPAALPVQEWVLTTAFLAALAILLARRVPSGILWSCLALVTFMPRFRTYFITALADAPLAILLSIAAVCAALWLIDGDRRHAVLCGVFLCAATLLKNEGLIFGLSLVVVLGVAILFDRPRRWRPVLFLGLVPVAAITPWKIWLATHNQPLFGSDYTFSELVHNIAGPHHAQRLGQTMEQLPAYLFSPNRWLLVVPLAIAAAAIVATRRPCLTVLSGGFVLLPFLALATVYWISALPLDWYISTSAERVVLSIVVASGTLLPLLLAESWVSRPEPATSLEGSSAGSPQAVGSEGLTREPVGLRRITRRREIRPDPLGPSRS